MRYNRQAFCDLKDKEKLKIIKEELSLVTHNGTTKDDLLMLLDWLYNRVVKKDLEASADWIPCSERMPEDGTYLCTLDGELVGEQEPFTGMCGIKNGKWDEEGCVIAWKPLPKPYKQN